MLSLMFEREGVAMAQIIEMKHFRAVDEKEDFNRTLKMIEARIRKFNQPRFGYFWDRTRKWSLSYCVLHELTEGRIFGFVSSIDARALLYIQCDPYTGFPKHGIIECGAYRPDMYAPLKEEMETYARRYRNTSVRVARDYCCIDLFA